MHPVRHIAFTNELSFARPREEASRPSSTLQPADHQHPIGVLAAAVRACQERRQDERARIEDEFTHHRNLAARDAAVAQAPRAEGPLRRAARERAPPMVR